MKIPLAEHFHSIQGEGYWVGTPMHFIRLAGCSVGRRVVKLGRVDINDQNSPSEVKELAPILPTGTYAWECHRFDGTPFWCDTDFGLKERVELDDLLAETWENHICLTGGEPLNHQKIVEEIISWCQDNSKQLHIETSGTISFDYPRDTVWMTVSPKLGCLPQSILDADEIKLLVQDCNTVWPIEALEHSQVFLSPVNEVDHLALDSRNLELALEHLRLHPNWRLSVQLHKYLNLR